MQNRRPTLRHRLAAFIAGGSNKSYIPSLDALDLAGWSKVGKTYGTKPEQLKANIGWVFTANQAIVESCASVELKLYRLKRDGDREEVMQHPILELLDQPNFAHTGEQLRGLHHTYLNLTGESYLLRLRGGEPMKATDKQLPDALQVLPSHLCEFKLGDRYSESTVKYGQTTYKIGQLIRDINPDPGNPYYGRSMVAAAAATIDTDEEMKRWNRTFFANNARPGMVFNLQGEMSDDSVDRLRQQLKDLQAGTDNAFKSLVLENGEVKPYMLTQHDLDFLASREFTRDEILAMLRVSPGVLGMTENVNRSNMDAALVIHHIINTVPRLRHEVRMWNNALVKPFDPTLELDFVSPVPEDREAKLKEAAGGVNKWLTIDEVRDMYGHEELPDDLGKQIYISATNVPLDMVGKITPGTSADEDDDTPEDEEKPDEAAGTKALIGVKKDLTPEQHDRIGEEKYQAYQLRAERHEAGIIRVMRSEFERQRAEALAWLNSNPPVTGKAHRKDWFDELRQAIINWEAADEAMGGRTAPLLFSIILDTGRDAIQAVGAQPTQFNPFAEQISEYYKARVVKIAQDVNDETEKQLRATLTEAVNAGESIHEMRARIEGVFGAASSYRAERIARTETTRAQGFADIEAWRQSGAVEAKEWFTAQDERRCVLCRELHGRTIPLEENFFDKGDVLIVGDKKLNMDYDDVPSCPAHANCRCVLLPVLSSSPAR